MQAKSILYVLFCAVLVIFGGLFFLRWLGVFLLVVVGVSKAYSAILRRGIVAARTVDRRYLFRYESVDIGVRIENNSLLPSFPLVVVDRAPGLYTNGREAHMLKVGPQLDGNLSYTVIPRHRGVFELGPLTVGGADPLGLFPFELRFVDPAEVVILPDIRRIDFPKKPIIPGGPATTNDPRFEEIQLPVSIRDYVPGDRMRLVHWKASARLGRLVVRKPARQALVPTVILLDLRAGAYPLRHRGHNIERAVEAATALTVQLTTKGHPVGLLCLGETRDWLPPSAGIGSLHEILRTLARAKQTDRMDRLADALLPLPRTNHLAFVGPPTDLGVVIARFDRGRLSMYLVGAEGPIPPGAVRVRTHGDF